jgi:hypothetical protein
MLMTEKGMIVRSPIKILSDRPLDPGRHHEVDAGDKVASVAKIVPEDEKRQLLSATHWRRPNR